MKKYLLSMGLTLASMMYVPTAQADDFFAGFFSCNSGAKICRDQAAVIKHMNKKAQLAFCESYPERGASPCFSIWYQHTLAVGDTVFVHLDRKIDIFGSVAFEHWHGQFTVDFMPTDGGNDVEWRDIAAAYVGINVYCNFHLPAGQPTIWP